jgi:hypothetical protein
MAPQSAESLLADQRANAVLGWLLVAFLGVVAAESVVGGDIQWIIFVAGVVSLCLVVPVAFRDPMVMLPWEVIALAALPTFGRAVATFGLASEFTVYISVAALALVVAVELDLFTSVRMTVGFAITFVVFVTLATAGTWALVRWGLDLTLGTNTLLVEGVSDETIHDELMVEFVYSALAGVAAGVVFEGYFRRRQLAERLPEEVTES